MTFFYLLRVSKDYFLHFSLLICIEAFCQYVSFPYCVFAVLCFSLFHLFKVLIGENEHSSLFQLLSHAALHRQQRQGDQEP